MCEVARSAVAEALSIPLNGFKAELFFDLLFALEVLSIPLNGFYDYFVYRHPPHP